MKDITNIPYATNIINIKTGEITGDLTFFTIIGVDINHLKKIQTNLYVFEKKDLIYSNLPAKTIDDMFSVANSVAQSKGSFLDNIMIPIQPIIYAKRFVHYLSGDTVKCIYINLTQERKQLDTYELTTKLYNFATKAGSVSPFYVDLINAPEKLWGSDHTAEFLNVEPRKDMLYNISDWTKRLILANGKDKADEILECYQNVVEGKEKEYSVKYQMFDTDGNKKWYHSLSKIIERDENGAATALYGLNIEIDELVRSQEQLKISEERLRVATESTKIATWEYDAINDTGYLSEKIVEIFGCSPVQHDMFNCLIERIHPDQIETLKNNFKNQISEHEQHTTNNYLVKNREENYIWVNISAKITKLDKAGKPSKMVGIVWDIDEQKRREEELKKQNITDELTGFYNAKYLKTYLEELTSNEDIRFALAYANVKNFRQINELYGYEFGDNALKTIAKHLKKHMHKTTAFFRDSGDEFIIISTTETQYESLKDNGITDADRERAKITIEVDGVILNIEFNRGIILYPHHSDKISSVVNLAKETLFLAKQSKTEDAFLYNNDIYKNIQYEKSVIDDFNNANIESEFEMYYQNIINVDDPNIELVESLVRWNHPKRGFLTPYHFIDIIEKSGQIITLFPPMLRKCLHQLNIWEKEIGRKASLSYNLSLNILKLEYLCESITEMVNEYNIESYRVHFELTESMFEENNPVISENIKKLRKLGFKVAIDDFGTGYSSLSRIKDLEFDMIKIDKIFADDIIDETNKIIIKMIKDIAHQNNATCTIEGVETKEQFNIFENLGIEYVQGYYFNKPMDAHDMSKFLSMKGTQQINIVWDDELLTGNEILDKDHIQLVERAKLLVEAFREKNKENIYAHMNRLFEFIYDHFDNIEMQMQIDYNYPNIEEHKIEHVKIMETFENFKQNVLKNPLRELNAIECCHLMTDWVYTHIKVYDKEFAKHIKEQ